DAGVIRRVQAEHRVERSLDGVHDVGDPDVLRLAGQAAAAAGAPEALHQPCLVQRAELLLQETHRNGLGLGDLARGHQPRAAPKRATEERGMRISVCLPTRNEAGTVGDIVGCIRDELVRAAPLVDEIVVVDSSSTDGTPLAAARAGALVYQDSEILPGLEPLG